MGTIIASAIVGAFVGISVWEMGKKVIRESKEGIKKQKAYDPHDEIY